MGRERVVDSSGSCQVDQKAITRVLNQDFLPTSLANWAEVQVDLVKFAECKECSTSAEFADHLWSWRHKLYPNEELRKGDYRDIGKGLYGFLERSRWRDTFWIELLPFIVKLAAELGTRLAESYQVCKTRTEAGMREHALHEPSSADLTEFENRNEGVNFGIATLPQGRASSVWITQAAAGAVLACCFLNLHHWSHGRSSAAQPHRRAFSAAHLLRRAREEPCMAAKLDCLLNYFQRLRAKSPAGLLSFTRKVLAKPLSAATLRASKTPLAAFQTLLRHQDASSSADMETRPTAYMKADFANKYLGGGVLGFGCVQEEIMFLLAPELLVGVLLCEPMADGESVEIAGAEQYNLHTGYAKSFRFKADFDDQTPRDVFGRRKSVVLAMDAIPNPGEGQFQLEQILREINKSACAFRAPLRGVPRWCTSTLELEDLIPASTVSTGNWGCGAYGGDVALKSMLQWIAASEAGIAINYHTFGDPRAAKLSEVVDLVRYDIRTVGGLWKRVESFISDAAGTGSVQICSRQGQLYEWLFKAGSLSVAHK